MLCCAVTAARRPSNRSSSPHKTCNRLRWRGLRHGTPGGATASISTRTACRASNSSWRSASQSRRGPRPTPAAQPPVPSHWVPSVTDCGAATGSTAGGEAGCEEAGTSACPTADWGYSGTSVWTAISLGVGANAGSGMANPGCRSARWGRTGLPTLNQELGASDSETLGASEGTNKAGCGIRSTSLGMGLVPCGGLAKAAAEIGNFGTVTFAGGRGTPASAATLIVGCLPEMAVG
mmetsp:Transcript_45931/g.104111  ORF Transcript_45931/g.104111 Transcript_45931/m.104111 type:complete len:235 (-) Transcript_45931:306-1010(-)